MENIISEIKAQNVSTLDLMKVVNKINWLDTVEADQYFKKLLEEDGCEKDDYYPDSFVIPTQDGCGIMLWVEIYYGKDGEIKLTDIRVSK